MDRTQTAVATITLVRPACEAPLLRSSLERLSRERMPLVVADGGSPAEFVEFVRALPGATLAPPPERGLVPQVRASLGAAAARTTPFVLYTEPDKEFFFENRLAEFIRRAPDGDGIGIVIAARSEESFDTFPAFQRFTESTINRLCGDYVERAGDYSYGPFLLHRDLVPHVQHVSTNAGCGRRPFLFATAHRLGLKVVHIVADCPCPHDQRSEDDHERVHRLRQLGQNIDGLVQAMTRTTLA